MIYFIGFFVLLAVGMPIAIAMSTTGLGYLFFTERVDPIIAAQRIATGIDSFSLMAIPFFLLAAEVMNRTGVTDRIFRLANSVVGSTPGGLGYVNVLASMMFGAMSGSAVADAVGLGRIEIKAMTKAGYAVPFSAAVTAASTTIAPILPPSISLVIFGVTSGTSIGALFVGGIIPGILIGITMMIVVYLHSRKHGYGRDGKFSFSEIVSALGAALLPLMTPVIIVGGIWGGIFTPTEAGAIAVLYALLLGVLVYRTVRLRDVGQLVYESVLESANMLFIIAVSSFVAWLLTMERVPLNLAVMIVEISPHPIVFMLLLNVALLVLGCFMASAPAIIMVTPIIMPAAMAMGIHPVHLGLVMVFNLMIGLLTPPIGLSMIAVSQVAGISPLSLIKAMGPFFVQLGLALLLLTLVPEFVLFLPRLWGLIG